MNFNGLLNSGKGPSLYRHELLLLHNRQNHRFSHTVDKIPVKLVPRYVCGVFVIIIEVLDCH